MGAGPKVAMVHKLKYEHIHLTSFSKMRVDLAAQVQHMGIANIFFFTSIGIQWDCI